jgi:hypothetical protein
MPRAGSIISHDSPANPLARVAKTLQMKPKQTKTETHGCALRPVVDRSVGLMLACSFCSGNCGEGL